MSACDASAGSKLERTDLLDFLLEAVEAVVVVDLEGRLLFASENASGWLGRPQDEVVGASLADLLPPATCRRIGDIRHAVLASGRPLTFEETFETASEPRRLLLTVGPLRSANDELIGFACKARDITRRVAAEAALRRSEEQFRLLAENADDIIFRYRLHPTPAFEYVSPSSTRHTGYSPEDHYANPHLAEQIVHPGDRGRFAEMIAGSCATPERFSLRWITRDGRTIWTEQRNVIIRDESGEVVAVEGVARDVTEQQEARLECEQLIENLHEEVLERQRAEEAALEAQAETERVLGSLAAVLIELDGEGRVVRWNAVAEHTLGARRDEVLGRVLADCAIAWNWKAVAQGIETARTEREPVAVHDVAYRRVSGEPGVLTATVSRVVRRRARSDLAGSDGVVVLATDVTARRELEHQLGEADKLRALGSLAAGVAHEISSPIQWVGGNLEFIQSGFDEMTSLVATSIVAAREVASGSPDAPDAARRLDAALGALDLTALRREVGRALSESVDGIERVAMIARAMREFSHAGDGTRGAVDLSQILERAITLARNTWKYVADVTTRFDRDLPCIAALPGDLDQAFLNILINAAEAVARVTSRTGQKGRIVVETRRRGPLVEVRIEDTGPGIAADVRPRIFEPFFTTKTTGAGVGQGLSIARTAIVDRHGGAIEVDTTVGEGSTVTVTLPVGRLEIARLPEYESAPPARERGTATT